MHNSIVRLSLSFATTFSYLNSKIKTEQVRVYNSVTSEWGKQNNNNNNTTSIAPNSSETRANQNYEMKS